MNRKRCNIHICVVLFIVRIIKIHYYNDKSQHNYKFINVRDTFYLALKSMQNYS